MSNLILLEININMIDIKMMNEILDNIILKNTNILEYNLYKEDDLGNIEYKRSIITYNNFIKINKLMRQILWRISEGFKILNKKVCYYLIGIEDNGLSSNLTDIEIEKNKIIINNIIKNSNINCIIKEIKYKNNNILLIKFWLKNNDSSIEYF